MANHQRITSYYNQIIQRHRGEIGKDFKKCLTCHGRHSRILYTVTNEVTQNV